MRRISLPKKVYDDQDWLLSSHLLPSYDSERLPQPAASRFLRLPCRAEIRDPSPTGSLFSFPQGEPIALLLRIARTARTGRASGTARVAAVAAGAAVVSSCRIFIVARAAAARIPAASIPGTFMCCG